MPPCDVTEAVPGRAHPARGKGETATMVMTERPVVRRVNIELTDREFARLLATARTEDVHRGGVYDLRGAIITIWERPWADTDAWKYLGRVGEIHYQHPA